MTYEDVVCEVRNTFETADARRVFEHVAFEIRIVGEAAGVMYFEVSHRACVIEPYNYYDNDGIITATAETLLKLARIEIHLKDALENGMVEFRGDQRKMKLCLENIRLGGVNYD